MYKIANFSLINIRIYMQFYPYTYNNSVFDRYKEIKYFGYTLRKCSYPYFWIGYSGGWK